ncbi:glycine zipper family protein [Candidatus Phycosocius spiralis]|uniref:Glycine-zipper-containing OmpA-like membrane domain-containing protein n=1 Tax=Candidatus Phycosocius spiralis TaxID=2815099 RepID=A0ABQ4PVX2_9PROT|nr:glycine zipper family protein [Candidatus Phycosocius spiralis]GIU67148.1 hypothetical protein PsB1_1302 [Candidatus Phycosocius spiralis]
MKHLLAAVVLTAGCLLTAETALAQTKSQSCEAYTRNAARSTPTSTGAARGAARGAVVGSFSGHAGQGAAIGAGVGATRRLAQKSRSYSWNYNDCMIRLTGRGAWPSRWRDAVMAC